MKTITQLLFIVTALCAGISHATTRDADGLTPLHRAAGRGQAREVARLIDEGEDVLALDRFGVSVLHKAVYSGSADTVRLLLEHGALLDLQSPSNGDTPLHDALYFKSAQGTGVIETLLARGAALTVRNRAGLTPLDSAKLLGQADSIALLEAADRARHSPAAKELMAAVRANDVAKTRALLARAGTPIEEADEEGFTPLLWAAREGFREITERLLERGANPNHLDKWMGANAGHKAAFWGRAEIIPLLARHQLEVDARGGYNGYTALHDAVNGRHYETVRALLAAGARVDIEGHDGKTPLSIARDKGDRKLLELLAGH